MYPESRRFVIDDDFKKHVLSGATVQELKQYISSQHNKAFTLKTVHNFRQRILKAEKGNIISFIENFNYICFHNNQQLLLSTINYQQ